MKKTARKKKIIAPKPENDISLIVESSTEPIKTKSMKKFLTNKALVAGSIVILIITISAGVIYGFSYFAKDAEPKSAASQEGEVESLLDEVNKIFLMPEGESPTVATVTDVEKLAGQPFFKNAQNGDKVIIFGASKQALLYRPSVKKIITMSPIDANSVPQNANETQATNSAQTQAESIPTPIEKLKVAVYNSTKEAGLAKKGSNLLDEDIFEISSRANAVGEYEKTTISVINPNFVSDEKLELIKSSYSKIKISKIPLPSDEKVAAGADIVIILGSDFAENY